EVRGRSLHAAATIAASARDRHAGRRVISNFANSIMRTGLIPVVLASAVFATAPARALQTGASRTALAIVSDAKNHPIVDLGADDFVIQEGGQPREVLSVRIADYPIVVLLDSGSEARTDFGLMRKAVERFVDRIGSRPVAIGTMGDPPT